MILNDVTSPNTGPLMRRFSLLALLLALVVAAGCGKKPAPAPDDGNPADPTGAKPAADPKAAERDKLLAGLRSNRQDTKRHAIEELSWLAEDDPAVLPVLVELLKDKATAGAGRTLPNQISSTREAAALAIMQCTHGEKVMKEKGFAVLRQGLDDPSPVIREHTAYTIGQLGAVAKPLATDVQKLCTDQDANVRGVAFDALRVMGVADPVALVKLLKHDDEEVVRLAAELIPLLPEVPEGAVVPLAEALASENSNVRTAAAEGLAIAGPKAASTAPLLADAIKSSYPAEYEPKDGMRIAGAEAAYWKALARIGEAAVAPTAKLLEHSNTLVRALAAQTLGEIGEPAKAAKEALKKALGDTVINVSVEAAVTLCKLGESKQEAIDLVKRALDVPTEGVAAAAIQGIPRMGDAGKELVPLALERMDHLNPNTRYAAVWLVGQLPPSEAAKAAADVGKRATDEFEEIRRLAGSTLEKLGPAGAPAAGALGKALASEEESDIRGLFVDALVAMGAGAKPALPGLLPLVDDKDAGSLDRAKVVAAVAVADPASPEVAAALVKVAGDPDVTVRSAAAEAMGNLNPLPPDALSTLVKLAKGDRTMEVRSAAVRALASVGPRAKGARPDLEAISGGQLPGLALWAKVALAAVDGDVQKAAPVIRSGLADRRPSTRAAAAEALLVIGPANADLPLLLKLLKDASGTTKAAAARAVGRLGAASKDAVPQLTRLLDDRESGVRLAAAEALGRIGPDAKPAVAKLKELRSDPLVQNAARKALDRIESK